MSIELPIIVYGNGEIFQRCFNAIAHIFGDNVFKNIFRMAVLLGGVTALFSAITQRDFIQCLRWFGRYYLVYFVLFLPRLDVCIDDHIADRKFDVVGVPLGLAVFASYATSIGNALTYLVEHNFGFEGDLQGLNYNHSGMMMASRMLVNVSQFKVTNLQFSGNLESFIKNCSKVTADNLLSTQDIWTTIMESVGNVGTFTYNGVIVPCLDDKSGEKGGRLTADLNSVIDKTKALYGKFLFPLAADSGQMLYHSIFSSYTYLLGLEASPQQMDEVAKKIVQQTLLANVIQNEIIKLLSLEPKQSFGYQMVVWLSLIKNVGEIMIYAGFMLVVLLALFPDGITILKNYILLLLWLQTWSPLYAIVNYICLTYVKSHLVGETLSLQFLLGLVQVNVDAITLAGYLSLGVPILAAALMIGVVIVFSQLTRPDVALNQTSVAMESFPTGLSSNAFSVQKFTKDMEH